MSKKNIQELKDFKLITNEKYRQYIDQTIKLYTDRKIDKFKTALKIAEKLSSRGQGPKSAIELLEKYNIKPSVKGKLTNELMDQLGLYNLIFTKKFSFWDEIKQPDGTFENEPIATPYQKS